MSKHLNKSKSSMKAQIVIDLRHHHLFMLRELSDQELKNLKDNQNQLVQTKRRVLKKGEKCLMMQGFRESILRGCCQMMKEDESISYNI